MALARCRKCGAPEGRTNRYVVAAIPLGYLSTAAICGSKGCEEPALIWFNDREKAEYDKGKRVFSFASNAMKVRVSSLE